MSDPLLSIAELQARTGKTYSGTELAQANAFIEDASALVREIAETDFHDPDTGAFARPEAIRPVVVAMVRRALELPVGAAAGLTGEQIGAYGWQAGGSEGSGRGGPSASLYATRREVRIIRRAAGRLGVKSIPIVTEWDQTTDPEVEVVI